MPSPPEDSVEAALWDRAARDFGRDETNRAFIEHGRQEGALARVANRYRTALATADDTQRAAIERRLEAIAALALLEFERTRVPTAPRRRPLWLYLLAFAVLALALYGLAAAFATL